jgi:hypothetical protein
MEEEEDIFGKVPNRHGIVQGIVAVARVGCL